MHLLCRSFHRFSPASDLFEKIFEIKEDNHLLT
jgi:hypothetical protein